MNIQLYLTPAPFSRAEIETKTAVIIDVLRCTTSVCAALSAGARGVIPVGGPGEAAEMRSKVGTDLSVLAGERHGVRIDNFHLGNSPSEFTPESVGDKLVIMTTTNGTAAFVAAYGAAEVLSCGLVNVDSVAGRLAASDRDVVIVCASREGQFSIEDTICGGYLIDLLREKGWQETILNDAASLAVLLFRDNSGQIEQAVAQGEHGRFLASIGFAEDIRTASAVNSMPVLPILRDGRLVAEIG